MTTWIPGTALAFPVSERTKARWSVAGSVTADAYQNDNDWGGVPIPTEENILTLTNKTCRVRDCDNAARARGVCGYHYNRWRGGYLDEELGPFRSTQKPAPEKKEKMTDKEKELMAEKEDLIAQVNDLSNQIKVMEVELATNAVKADAFDLMLDVSRATRG